MHIVGFVGLIGSGKDTVANMFAEETGGLRDSFASPLKDVVAAIFGWERALLEGDTAESREFRETTDMFWSCKLGIPNFTPRLALQLLGTEVMRNHFHTDIWIHSLEYRIRSKHQENSTVIVSDARFQNELDLIRRLGGKIIWVQRGKLPEWFDVAKRANAGDIKSKKLMAATYKHIHESEWNWAGHETDYILYNNRTLGDLRKQILEVKDNILLAVA
jgi:hypothetical protein